LTKTFASELIEQRYSSSTKTNISLKGEDMNVKYKIVEVMENNDAEQSIVGWGSKPIPDRDGELIKSSAWKLEAYRKNPVLMLSHDYSSPPVGKCLWVKADNSGLRFKAKFASTERGKEIYQLYKEGIMSGFSVGFSVNAGGSVDHPTDAQYKGLKRVYSDVELLEISCVAIPACPEALIEQVKSGKIVSKQLKDEMDHIIELVEKVKAEEAAAPDCPGGGACGVDFGKFPECKGCENAGECKAESGSEGEAEKEVSAVVVEKEAEVVEKATPKCPADGEYGQDYDSFAECEECSFAEGCEEMSGTDEEKALRRKPKEEEEGGDKKKPYTKEDSPSIYDLVRYLNRALSEAGMEPDSSYVVDVLPHSYPDGEFIYCKEAKYYKADYQYHNTETTGKFCNISDGREEIEQEVISEKYHIEIEQKEAEVVQKEGRVLSEKNRKLLKDCVDKMGECHGMLSGFHEATAKPDAYTNLGKAVDEEDEGFEIEQKEVEQVEFDLTDIVEKSAEKTDEDDGTMEIDLDMLKSVLKDAFAENVKSGAEAAITNVFKKMKGNVI
jgi:HK97 family phage prohead protease